MKPMTTEEVLFDHDSEDGIDYDLDDIEDKRV